MAKMERKSVSELLAVKPKKPSIEEIEQITQNIHTQKQAAITEGVLAATTTAAPKATVETATKTMAKTTAPTPPKTSLVQELDPQDMDDLGDRIKRISVHTPLALYIKAKTKTTIKGVSMMAYILELMEKDLAKNG